MIDTVLSQENILFRNSIRKFAEKELGPHVKDWEKEGKYPREYYKKLADMGLLGLLVPEKYGGAGGEMIDLVILCEEMGRIGVSVPLTHISACCRVIAHYGTESQKSRYLPDLSSGKKIAAYCQTEANAGSDAGSMSSYAEEKEDWFNLTGRKVFISNGRIASVFVVLAKTEKNLEKPTKGIAMFIVDRETPGVSVGKTEELMGRHCSSLDEIVFDDVRVAKENLLVPAGGSGFRSIMNEFNSERCGNASFCVGFAQGAYERALLHCKERKQFGQPIANFQGVQWTLAEMAIKINAARLLVYDAIIKEKRGASIAKEAAMAKKFANETAVWVCDQAIQLHGAYGYTVDYEVERYYRDVRGWSMGGGTTQMCLNRIAHELTK